MKTLGRIVAFDESKCTGVVQIDLETLRFHSTSFRSATSFRWPRVGEQVEIIMNQHGELVSLEGS